jgi:hypothetical protein
MSAERKQSGHVHDISLQSEDSEKIGMMSASRARTIRKYACMACSLTGKYQILGFSVSVPGESPFCAMCACLQTAVQYMKSVKP